MAKDLYIKPYLEQILKMLEDGASLRMIAREIGTNHHRVKNELNSLGIATPTKSESAKNTWKNHRHPHLGRKGEASYMFGRKMSAETRAKMQPVYDRIAEKQRIYRKMHNLGYVLVYMPDHPCADRSGYVAEHRAVAESKVNRRLTSNDIVHHINGDKTDNRPENLDVLTRSEHAKIHHSERKDVIA